MFLDLSRTRATFRIAYPQGDGMAIYHLHAKTWSKGAGQGAGGHARYVLRQGPYAKRVVERAEGSAVQRVEEDRAAEVVASYSGHLPAWAEGDPVAYWDAADAYERANGTVYRELEFALPGELSERRNLELAQAFAEALARVDRGATPYTLVLHRSARDPELLHCHLMLSDRVNDGYERSPERWFRRAANRGKDPARGGAPKTQARIAQDWLGTVVRPLWAEFANAALEQARCGARIDHRSLEAQRRERELLAEQAQGRGDELAAARYRKAAGILDRPAQPK
ncbi:MobA/MobL family protein, partial [Acidithiobacillus thiooxidans]|uniref:MobA/MobL family protein n=1 Tax=Acidithiobacillus thiooxidans TaxID=930 RepID=UPI001F3F2C37